MSPRKRPAPPEVVAPSLDPAAEDGFHRPGRASRRGTAAGLDTRAVARGTGDDRPAAANVPPATKKDRPAAKKDRLATKSSRPDVKKDVLGVKADDLGGKGDDLGTKAEDLGAKGEDPGAKADDLGAKAEDPGTKAEDLGAKGEDRGAKAEDLGAKADDLGAKAEDLGAKAEDLGAKAEDLGATAEDLGATAEDLGTKAEGPAAKAGFPAADPAHQETKPAEPGPKLARRGKRVKALAPPVEVAAGNAGDGEIGTPADPASSVALSPPSGHESREIAPAAAEIAPESAPVQDLATPEPVVELASPDLQAARAAFAEVLALVAALPPPPPPLDPAVEQAVMGAAIAAIEGARPRNLEMALEALLFSTNQPLTESELAAALGSSAEEVKCALASLEKTLSERPSSISLWSRAKNGQPAWILDVKAAFRRDVAALAPPALRVALVETLALIALNQPVSQRRLVSERGSTVYEHVRELTELGYVQRARRGINFYLKTTPEFANEFGLPNEPEAIRHALAKAAGLAGAPGAIASERVWMEGPAPAALQAQAEELAAQKWAEEEAARAAAHEAARREAEAAETARLADEARKQAEAAARLAAEEAAAATAAEAKRIEEENALRAAAEARRVEAEAKRKAEEEEARILAIAAAARATEECVVQGGDLEDVVDAKNDSADKKKKKGRRDEAGSDLSDAFSAFGGGEAAW